MFGNDIDLDRVAVVDENNHKFTYRDLNEKAQELVNVIPKRSLIVLLCERDIETLSFYYCMVTNHVVPIMLKPDISDSYLENIIDTYHPEYIWRKKHNDNDKNIVYGEGEHVIERTLYESPMLHESLAIILSTSGSTGSNKMVRISYDNIIENSRTVSEYFGINQGDMGVTTLPINYILGLCVLHYNWYKGAGVYVTDRSMIDDVYWKELKKNKVTSLHLIPYNYEIIKRLNIFNKDDYYLRYIMWAGEQLQEDVIKSAYEMLKGKGIHCYIGYGQTESVGALCVIGDEEILSKPRSIGKPLNCIARCDCEKNELIFESKSACMGYAYDIEDLMLGDVNKGCLFTGDCAKIDSDGYIYIIGRKSRFVKVLGIRYSLDEIEILLRMHFCCKDILCSGSDNCLRIYVKGMVVEDEIKNYCSEKFAINKRMINVNNIDQIPRNDNGKIDYLKLS